MKKELAKQKAINATKVIIEAAKDLTKAEQAYYGRKPKEPQESDSQKVAALYGYTNNF